MNYRKMISVIMVCALAIAVTACHKTQSSVINTTNALYAKETFKIGHQTEKTEMQGRVIKLGTTKNTNFGPSFEFEKLRVN